MKKTKKFTLKSQTIRHLTAMQLRDIEVHGGNSQLQTCSVCFQAIPGCNTGPNCP